MKKIKITSWNIRHLERLTDAGSASSVKRKQAILTEIARINPDIICLLEGPNGEAKVDQVCTGIFNEQYKAIKATDGNYNQKGTQWIWFLVKSSMVNQCSLLLVDTWVSFSGGSSWQVNYWGNFQIEEHEHYRQPQVLILNINGQRLELIGVHLKSKFVNTGESMWKAGGQKRNDFILEALKARIKMTTEAGNIRNYINKKFSQVEKPAIIVMGDFNDGPGKEYFESRYLFFDLISNIQGNIFEADKFLNHALFDYPDDLRWSVLFDDFVEPERDPHILLDHILFTQALVNWNLNVTVEPHAGLVEHEIHDEINASLTLAQKTSDHKPVSIMLSIKE